jgi:hypothetical protein
MLKVLKTVVGIKIFLAIFVREQSYLTTFPKRVAWKIGVHSVWFGKGINVFARKCIYLGLN